MERPLVNTALAAAAAEAAAAAPLLSAILSASASACYARPLPVSLARELPRAGRPTLQTARCMLHPVILRRLCCIHRGTCHGGMAKAPPGGTHPRSAQQLGRIERPSRAAPLGRTEVITHADGDRWPHTGSSSPVCVQVSKRSKIRPTSSHAKATPRPLQGQSHANPRPVPCHRQCG
jgi:hypothetical protein